VPLYLLGARMRAVYPQVPLFPAQGLAIALFSYDDRLSWGFNADVDIVPDLGRFRADIAAAFKELQRVARQHPVPGAPRRPARRAA
jgi:hypothetical protein